MCEIINIVDGIQKVLDYNLSLLLNADETENDFKNKIKLLYYIDDLRNHLLKARMLKSSIETENLLN